MKFEKQTHKQTNKKPPTVILFQNGGQNKFCNIVQ